MQFLFYFETDAPGFYDQNGSFFYITIFKYNFQHRNKQFEMITFTKLRCKKKQLRQDLVPMHCRVFFFYYKFVKLQGQTDKPQSIFTYSQTTFRKYGEKTKQNKNTGKKTLRSI